MEEEREGVRDGSPEGSRHRLSRLSRLKKLFVVVMTASRLFRTTQSARQHSYYS